MSKYTSNNYYVSKYASNDCECNGATTTTAATTLKHTCDCGVIDDSRETQLRISNQVRRFSSHRTSHLASFASIKSGATTTGVGVKHGSYERYLARKKARCLCK
jgi:hypothetical protein